MNSLGYYAKDKNKDLFQFEWFFDVFYILKNGERISANADDYEILEIGFFTADD
jgi:hypothetical protein